jgi:hypothetical protein
MIMSEQQENTASPTQEHVVMPSGEIFELNTFSDLLQLNDDQLDRLCAQLPSVIKQVKCLSAIMGVALDGKEAEMLTPLRWKDDEGKGLKINITSGGEDILLYESKSA